MRTEEFRNIFIINLIVSFKPNQNRPSGQARLPMEKTPQTGGIFVWQHGGLTRSHE
jgi:hypothetical protein